MVEVRCANNECPFAPCEQMESEVARRVALAHAWTNRGHRVELWVNGAPRSIYVVNDIRPWVTADGAEALKLQIKATLAEAVRAYEYRLEFGDWPVNLSKPARVLLDSVPLDPEEHEADWHCLVDEETGCCAICGVGHDGPPCPVCRGVGFHRLPCILLDPARAIDPVQPGGAT